ncbi:MAG TPA: acyl-CoA thioesterase [Candidatus Dormibacteraeota bacterium]|nr:acyl-CoA thioesterase [Candidatus Dormibacteraeota bacterium]
MTRWDVYEVPVDTGLFTPLGLQPTAVCRLGFNAAGSWLAEHAISHRTLVAEHRTGFVVWSAQLNFDQPVCFLDADSLELRVTGRIRGAGTQFECNVSIGESTRMSACCVPLRLDGDPALSGSPARLGADVLSAFLPDEIDSRPHLSPVPQLCAEVNREGRLVAGGQTSFVIHRHQCEVADQWFWPEAVSLAGAGREELVRSDKLRSGIATPLRRLDLLYNRPFFLFDEGMVSSTAYAWRERLVFIHELHGIERGRPRAIAVEQFD